MEKVKGNNKKLIIVLLIILLILIIVFGIYFFSNSKSKQYSVYEVSEYKYYALSEDGKYGVINTLGEIVVQPLYDSIKIPNPEKPIFICEKDNNTIVLNENSEEMFTKYDEVTAISINGIVSSLPYEKMVLRYKLNEKYGLIDFNGKEITKPIYDEIVGLENKESELLVKRNNKYGVINDKGAKLIKEEYDQIVADGFYTDTNKYELSGYIVSNKTEDGYRYVYISYKLEKLLNPEYTEISRIFDANNNKDIYLIVSKNGQYGVVKNKNVIINYNYQGIEYDKNNNVFELNRNYKYGIADINGKEILPVEYISIEIKGLYLQAFTSEENYMFFNINGTQIEDSGYTSLLKTNNENYYITIDKEGFYGIIDSKNNKILDNKYNYLEYLFGDCFIATKEDGYLGVINAQEEILIDFKYEVLQKIDDTNIIEAKILKENKTELYSNNFEKICSATNVSIYKEDKYIKVFSSNDEIKYFNFNGDELVNKDIFVENELLASKNGDKWGFVDRQGNVIVDYQYDKVTEFNQYGFAGIKQNDKWGIIDKNKNIVIEPIYVLQESNLDPEFLGQYYKVYYGYGESYYTNQVNK